MVGTAFFFKKIISLVTSVLADSEKVVLGKRIAPKKSALSEIYLLTLPSFLSRVPLEVTKQITPPGAHRSNAFDSDR